MLQSRDEKGRFKALEPEIKALATCARIIDKMNSKAQRRIVQYLYSRISGQRNYIFPREEMAGE